MKAWLNEFKCWQKACIKVKKVKGTWANSFGKLHKKYAMLNFALLSNKHISCALVCLSNTFTFFPSVFSQTSFISLHKGEIEMFKNGFFPHLAQNSSGSFSLTLLGWSCYIYSSYFSQLLFCGSQFHKETLPWHAFKTVMCEAIRARTQKFGVLKPSVETSQMHKQKEKSLFLTENVIINKTSPLLFLAGSQQSTQ